MAVTVYELLTTILPFEAPTTAGVTVAICNAQFSPPSHYRADLLADIDLWFARALSKEPLDRFHDARELARAFSRAASAEALLAPADPAAAAQVAPELEDEEEEEEKTVKWDLPADWAPGSSRSALTQVIQRPILSEPPPLPNRAPSSRPPAPVGLSRPGMFPQLGSVSAALAARVVAGASPRVWPRVPNRLSERASIGWVAGALLAAGALILWSYQSSSDREKLATEMLEAPPTSTRALVAAKVKSAPEPSEAKSGAHARRPLAGPPRDRQVHAAQLHAERGAEPQELPDIIRTDELPTAPEVDDIEVTDDEATAEGASGEGEADEARPDTAPAPHSPPAPAPIASTIPAANKPAPSITTSNSVAVYRKPPAPRAAPKPAASSVPNRKAASAKAAPNCNPPFYYDNNNIRRLKLECL